MNETFKLWLEREELPLFDEMLVYNAKLKKTGSAANIHNVSTMINNYIWTHDYLKKMDKEKDPEKYDSWLEELKKNEKALRQFVAHGNAKKAMLDSGLDPEQVF